MAQGGSKDCISPCKFNLKNKLCSTIYQTCFDAIHLYFTLNMEQTMPYSYLGSKGKANSPTSLRGFEPRALAQGTHWRQTEERQPVSRTAALHKSNYN